MIKIYQYFTEPNLSSNSSKKSSSNNTTTNNKKQTITEDGTTSPKDQQYQEALRDFKISWISK
jgi:hypothetical protein